MPILAFREQSAISAIGDGLSQQQLGSNFCVRRRRTPRGPGPPPFSIRGFSLPSPLSGARDLTTIGLGIPSKKCSLAQAELGSWPTMSERLLDCPPQLGLQGPPPSSGPPKSLAPPRVRSEPRTPGRGWQANRRSTSTPISTPEQCTTARARCFMTLGQFTYQAVGHERKH